MLVGYPPFWGKTNEEIFARTKSGKVNFFKSDWIHISSSARRVCRGMLKLDPDERLTPGEVLENSWILNPPRGTGITAVPERIKILDQMRREQKASTAASDVPKTAADSALTGHSVAPTTASNTLVTADAAPSTDGGIKTTGETTKASLVEGDSNMSLTCEAQVGGEPTSGAPVADTTLNVKPGKADTPAMGDALDDQPGPLPSTPPGSGTNDMSPLQMGSGATLFTQVRVAAVLSTSANPGTTLCAVEGCITLMRVCCCLLGGCGRMQSNLFERQHLECLAGFKWVKMPRVKKMMPTRRWLTTKSLMMHLCMTR